ncbi:hypothetical protein SDC9_172465 [bioreactor metagenome]|uniref:Uncharacterized protein n=1 Tax=bioreactor metagenome TaxID=1076179 RepID=A0A645GDT1_9ZZZZ|nr:hypothetical protein [Candidatus Metalachnospira sp.]
MYAKLTDKNIERLKMPIKSNGMDIFTNDENIIIANGYKPVVYADMPSEDAVSHWEETDTSITQVWEVIQEGVTE